MLKSVKYLFKYSATYIFGVPLCACAVIAAYSILFGASKHNGEYIGGMIFAIISMMSYAVCMNFYACFGNIAQSMGSTRKSFFAASQIMKLLVCVTMFLSMLLVIATLNFFYQIDYLKGNSNLLFALLGLSLILGTMGEAIGIFCTRWGRVGIVAYIVVCLLFGIAVGVVMAIGLDSISGIISFVMQSPWIILGSAIIFSAAMSVANRIIYKKSVVT